MLRSQDLKDVIRISAAALACSGVDELRNRVIALLPEVFHRERTCFYLAHKFPYFRIDLSNIITSGIDKKYMDLYRQRFYKVDPFYKTVDSPRAVVTTSDTIARHDLMRSEYYNEFLKPQSILFEMAMYLRSNGHLLGLLVLLRSPEDHEFSQREKAKAEMLAPSLTAALEKVTILDRLAKSNELISSMGPQLPYEGMIVLDESMQPLFMNEEARRSLAPLAEGAEASRNPLYALPEKFRIQLEELINSAKRDHDDAGKREVTLLSRKTGQTASCCLSVEYPFRGSGLCVIGVGHDKRSEHLKALGLTRRESEIAGFVCQGLKNSEIAARLFISEATVENHLHSIFEKLGVKNRSSLIYRVSNVHTG